MKEGNLVIFERVPLDSIKLTIKGIGETGREGKDI